MGRQLVSRGLATALSQKGGAPALPDFWDFPLSMTTFFTEERTNWAW